MTLIHIKYNAGLGNLTENENSNKTSFGKRKFGGKHKLNGTCDICPHETAKCGSGQSAAQVCVTLS